MLGRRHFFEPQFCLRGFQKARATPAGFRKYTNVYPGLRKYSRSSHFLHPGAPGAEKATEVAARERNEQLLLAGREAVGVEVGMPKRHAARQGPEQSKDKLDKLMDSLDELDF